MVKTHKHGLHSFSFLKLCLNVFTQSNKSKVHFVVLCKFFGSGLEVCDSSLTVELQYDINKSRNCYPHQIQSWFDLNESRVLLFWAFDLFVPCFVRFPDIFTNDMRAPPIFDEDHKNQVLFGFNSIIIELSYWTFRKTESKSFHLQILYVFDSFYVRCHSIDFRVFRKWLFKLTWFIINVLPLSC